MYEAVETELRVLKNLEQFPAFTNHPIGTKNCVRYLNYNI